MTFSTLGTDRQTNQPVYLYKASRTQGTYIIGATGTGKSGLLENLIIDDTKQRTGVVVIDPHGDLIRKVIARLRSQDELDRVILIDPLDTDYAPGINIYQCDNPLDDTQVEQAKERVLHIFTLSALERGDEKLGVRVSQGILNSAYTLIDSFPVYRGTMLELQMLFTEDVPRRNMVKQVEGKDEAVADYWKIYETFDQDEKNNRADMVINKVQGYRINRFLRRIIGQSRSTINFREVIDSNPGKIVLVKLRRDHPELAQLIGSLVIAQLLGAALSREREGSERRQVHIYADEFQLYATEDFTYLLTECRKYGMAVTVAHQSRDFIDLKNKAATLQAANLITLRVIKKDADEIAGQYNIKPQAAWEEEKEKEWVEELEPERHERVEEVVEDGVEEIKTVSPTPIDTIVLHRPHANQFVNEFFKPWREIVQTAHSTIHEGGNLGSDITNTTTTRRGTTYTTEKHFPGNFYSNRPQVTWAKITLDFANPLLFGWSPSWLWVVK